MKNIIVISDTHCGCGLSIGPKENMTLDTGQIYTPSTLQRGIYKWWETFWTEWVPWVTKGEPYAVVHNGDAVDGVHHNSVYQITQNLVDQEEMAYRVLAPVVDKAVAYYHIRGTEAHVGKSAQHEESLAKRLGAVKNSTGNHARWEMWMDLEGYLIHFLHHIGTTSSSAHESSAVNAELTAELVEAARWGKRPPNVIVRSHRHRNIEVRLPSEDHRKTAREGVGNDYSTAVVTPAWQGKTPFAFKIAGARVSVPQFGGILIRATEDGIFTRCCTWTPARETPESPAKILKAQAVEKVTVPKSRKRK